MRPSRTTALAALGTLTVVAVAIAAILLGPWRGTNEPSGELLLQAPGAGQTVAAFAADRRPIWLVGHRDGSIRVLDAFSTHVPFDVNKPTWWCPESRVFEDPFHGSLYSEFGHYVAGPAPRGLATYGFAVEQDKLVIADAPNDGPAAGQGPGNVHGCLRTQALLHDYGRLPEALSPSAAAASGESGWQRVHARLLPEPERAAARLCWAADPVSPDDCAEVELPGMIRYVRGGADRFFADTWADADWLVRAEGGRIVEIALLPED